MSISKKVFWIFFTLTLFGFVGGVNIYLIQKLQSQTIDTFNSINEFQGHIRNLNDIKLRLMNDLNSINFNPRIYIANARRAANKIKNSGFVLSSDLRTQVGELDFNIDNYEKAIYELMTIKKKQMRIYSEIRTTIFNINFDPVFKTDAKKHYDISSIMVLMNRAINKRDYSHIKELREAVVRFKQTVKDNALKTKVDKLMSLVEEHFLNHFAIIDRVNFLEGSANNFFKFADYLIADIRFISDEKNDHIIYFSIFTNASGLALAILFWVLIRNYLQKFLKNHSSVIYSIKKDEKPVTPEKLTPDEFGDVIKTMVRLSTDLSEKTKELQESESRYRDYIDNSPEPIMVTAVSGDIVEVNKAAEEKFGYTVEQLEEMKIFDLWADDTVYESKKLFEKMKEQGMLSKVQKFQHKTGLHFYMSVNAVRTFNGTFIGFCQDITSRVQLEEELKKLNADLQMRVELEVEKNSKSERLLQQQKKFADMGHMISAIAHQWRQPLNALGLFVQDIADAKKMNELDDEYIDKFENQAMDIIKHMSLTIDDFRYFFNTDREFLVFNLVESVIHFLRLIEAQFNFHDIKTRMTVDCYGKTFMVNAMKDVPEDCRESAMVYGAESEFKQVLQNILMNAKDALCEKTTVINKIIKIHFEISKSGFVVEVSDNAGGIPDDVLGKVFDPYFTTKEEGQGTGLGLYISKIIVDEHFHGTLTASNRKHGAVFTISIPRTNIDEIKNLLDKEKS